MFNTALSLALAALAGAGLVVQQALNANLRTALNSAAWSGFTSYLVGTLFMLGLAAVLRDPVPPASVAARIPWWAWSGGLFGGSYIALAIVLLPRLGAATFIGLLVAGQMAASLLVDQIGFLGLAQRSADAPKLVGMALIVLGVVLIRR